MPFPCQKVRDLCLVLCRLIDTPISSPVRFDIEETETDLSRRTELTSGSVYSIRAFATNAIGESNSSNAIEYTKPQGLVIIGNELS